MEINWRLRSNIIFKKNFQSIVLYALGGRGAPKNTFSINNKIGPRQANLVLIAYASSEGSGEPAHPRSHARTFAARSYKQ